MPYPVLPPEPPAIVTPSAAEDVSHPSSPAEISSEPIAQASLSPSSPDAASLSAQAPVVEALAAPAPPERFAPEFSSSQGESQAALLGSPVAIALPVESSSTDTSSDRSSEPDQQAETVDSSQISYSADLSAQSVPANRSAQQPAATPRLPNVEPSSPQIIEQQIDSAPIQLEDAKSTLEGFGHRNLPHIQPDSDRSPLSLPASPGSRPSVANQSESSENLESSSSEADRVTPDANRPTLTIPDQPAQKPPQTPGQTPAQTPTPPNTVGGQNVTMADVIELSADRQEYDEQRRVFTGEGNVLLRFRGALLDADRVQVNIPNRIAVAEGQAALTRGEQVLRGERFEYNLVQGTGTIFNASGEVFLPTASSDFAPTLPTDVSAGVPSRPVSDRITAGQPVSGVSTTGGINIGVGVGEDAPSNAQQGTVRRLRYEAERIEFTSEGWQAQNIRITNDPFSPPELELRADQATFTRLSPLRDEIRAKRPRLVFDQGFSLPLLRSRVVLDRRERDPALLQFGYDEGDRGGLFVERSFEPISTNQVRLRLTPQFYVQRALSDSSITDLSSYGLKARLDATLSPTTSLTGRATFTTFDPDEIDDETRASLRLRQLIGTHTLALDYSYRDRLFNGSLGFQDVQSSLGAILISPVIPLGKTGINLSYQAGAQYINADTDRLDLLDPIRTNNRVSLGRFQASAALSRGFPIWTGKPLPATATEGLRYTPSPVVPYLQVFTGLRGVLSGYTSEESQQTLTGTIGLQGQIGHFSRPFFDYTGFNISYSQTAQNGESPFLFDRVVDTSVLSLGITQQIYGPFRVGFQTSINLETDEAISTDYILEYSRRTYGVILRYNPELEIGSIGLRISDFNWNGGAQPFAGSGIRSVEGGVTRQTDD